MRHTNAPCHTQNDVAGIAPKAAFPPALVPLSTGPDYDKEIVSVFLCEIEWAVPYP